MNLLMYETPILTRTILPPVTTMLHAYSLAPLHNVYMSYPAGRDFGRDEDDFGDAFCDPPLTTSEPLFFTAFCEGGRAPEPVFCTAALCEGGPRPPESVFFTALCEGGRPPESVFFTALCEGGRPPESVFCNAFPPEVVAQAGAFFSAAACTASFTHSGFFTAARVLAVFISGATVAIRRDFSRLFQQWKNPPQTRHTPASNNNLPRSESTEKEETSSFALANGFGVHHLMIG